MQELIAKIKAKIKSLHIKKTHVEFVTALLSIPVLLTVILINLNNLNTKNLKQDTTSDTKKSEIIISLPATKDKATETTPIPTPQCKPDIGPIDISYPEENDTVSDNPLKIDINYKSEGYCAVVWSYRINGGSWSDYDDKSIALYNMPSGDVVFELRVKSLISGREKTLKRNFTYKSSVVATTPTPTPTTTVTPSPTTQATVTP